MSDRTAIPSRADDAYNQFEAAPLAVDDVAFVLKTDVRRLLRESSGRAFGLPQMTEPSDQLAELYIEPMRSWRPRPDPGIQASD